MERLPNSEANRFQPDLLRERYERERIESGPEFGQIYSSYSRDMTQVENLTQLFSQDNNGESLGPVGEALVYDRLNDNILGNGIIARPASLYDDYKHGADVLLEATHMREPLVSTVDVTINQKDLKGVSRAPHFAAEENARPVGLDEKLKRVKRHIDYVSDISASNARELGAWLQGGGLHEPETRDTRKLFEMAEKAMLVKYYVNPESSEDPHKPRYVLGGPQIVLSLDTPFVNRVITDVNRREQHVKAIDSVLQIESGYGIGALQGYLDKKVKESSNRNFIFDSHYTSTRAWADLFENEEQQEIFKRAIAGARGNADVNAQVAYYMDTWNKAFSR